MRGHRGKDVSGHHEAVAIGKPRGEASEARPADSLIVEASLQNFEKINSYCPHPARPTPACGTLL